MKAHEVPCDDGRLEGFQRGAYAVDAEGRYTLVASTGWDAETAATNVAWEDQDRFLRECWEAVRRGRRSPLAYHMARRQMTPALLARNAGVGRLRVEWHLRPWGFRRVPEGTLRRYAACLDLPAEELRRLPDEPERNA